jgi:hypothetical protein
MTFPEFAARHLTVAAVACSALLVIGAPPATADPETDGQGFVNSTARCNPPETVVAFGSTEEARVAICKTPSGQLEYRGVRVQDGARLVAPASQSTGGAFVAKDDGKLYTVTASSLIVSAGQEVISKEPMINFYQPGTGGASREKSTPAN